MASPGSDPLDRPKATGMDRTGSDAEAAKEKAENLNERAKEKASEIDEVVEVEELDGALSGQVVRLRRRARR